MLLDTSAPMMQVSTVSFPYFLKRGVLAGALPGVQINDAAHGFGAIDKNAISGDPRIYGRIYIATNGRGVFYGDINERKLSAP